MTFEEMVEHKKVCTKLDLPCSYKNCSARGFHTIEALKAHLVNECPYTRFHCKYCHAMMRRMDQEDFSEPHEYEECQSEMLYRFKELKYRHNKLYIKLKGYREKQRRRQEAAEESAGDQHE